MNITLKSERFKDCNYQKTGSGFPVVLLHGFGENSSIFDLQVKELQKHFQVITPDLPGTGQSALPTEEVSMELLADFVFEILQQEKIEKTILFGHSMGGYTTLAFAEKYPEKLLAYGLLHSSAYADDEAKKENRRKSIKLIQNEGKEVFLKAMIPNLYSEQSRQMIPHLLQNHLTMALEISSDSLMAYYNAMINRPDRTHVYQNNLMPVLFVVGKEDNAISFTDVLKQVTMSAVSKLLLLDGVGHTGMYEATAKVNETLINFCNSILDDKKS